MKKLTILLSAIILSASAAFAQPVSDHGVIPIGVTLNSILRLNITSGGNIEFIVSTIDQYTNGIANANRYDTHFTVASSVDFNVNLTPDQDDFVGVGDASNTLPLNNLGFTTVSEGTGADGTNWNLEPLAVFVDAATAVPIVTSIANNGAGDVGQNAFVINWEFGTQNAPMNATSLLAQSILADRYVINVLVDLIAQ
jgi:hypothetical protein